MTGSEIITNALYNVYGETTAPVSIQTRAQKELYDLLIKVQRAKCWWFSRTEIDVPVAAGVDEIDLSTYGLSIAEIHSITVTPTVGSKYQLTRINDTDADANVWTDGNPAFFTEIFTGYDDHKVELYPAPAEAISIRIMYRKIFKPDVVSGAVAPQTDMLTYSDSVLDILGQYLEAALTMRLATILDYSEKAASFAKVGSDEFENLQIQNYDYNKQGFNLLYGGN